MRHFQAISTLLLLTGIGFLLFDLMYQYAAHGQFKFLSIEGLWTDIDKSSFESAKAVAESYIPANQLTFFLHLPAASVLLMIAAVFYLPFRLLSLLGVGKKKS